MCICDACVQNNTNDRNKKPFNHLAIECLSIIISK